MSALARQLPFLILLLAASGVANAVTKCQRGDQTLYTAASCPAGFKNVTAGMRPTVSTISKSEKTRQQEQAYLSGSATRAQQAWERQAAAQSRAYAIDNTFWNQCQALDLQARASERAMRESEYWDRSDRYRQALLSVRDQQYQMGCYG